VSFPSMYITVLDMGKDKSKSGTRNSAYYNGTEFTATILEDGRIRIALLDRCWQLDLADVEAEVSSRAVAGTVVIDKDKKTVAYMPC
jgi:hypothetical protein